MQKAVISDQQWPVIGGGVRQDRGTLRRGDWGKHLARRWRATLSPGRECRSQNAEGRMALSPDPIGRARGTIFLDAWTRGGARSSLAPQTALESNFLSAPGPWPSTRKGGCQTGGIVFLIGI